MAIDKTLLKETLTGVFRNFKNAINQYTEINTKRADGGWSVGEIGNHIVKATRSDFGATQKANRPYDQHAASIKALFLDFEQKFPAAPQLEPDARRYSKDELFSKLDTNLAALYAMIDKDDLTEICIEIELPGWGVLTKFEWLVLIENHVIRHTKQVTDFKNV